MNSGARGRSWVPAGRVAREPQTENQCCHSPSQKVLKHEVMSMTRGVKRSSPCVTSLGRAGDRTPGCFHFTMLGLLLMGLAGLFCALGTWPAARSM